jgi:RimJ/RimL family protein N-acetyltransferase
VDPTAPARRLTDGTVVIREAHEGDLDAIERGVTDPDVVRRFGRRSASAAEILEINRRAWLDLSGPTFAVCEADEVCVGLVWVNRKKDRPDQGAVGYFLLPEARGRGLASRAVRLIARWAFDELHLELLQLFAEADNAPSLRVASRAGFRATGELRPGPLWDGGTVEYVVHERRREDGAGATGNA